MLASLVLGWDTWTVAGVNRLAQDHSGWAHGVGGRLVRRPQPLRGTLARQEDELELGGRGEAHGSEVACWRVPRAHARAPGEGCPILRGRRRPCAPAHIWGFSTSNVLVSKATVDAQYARRLWEIPRAQLWPQTLPRVERQQNALLAHTGWATFNLIPQRERFWGKT